MSKTKKYGSRPKYDDDGMKQPSVKDIRRDKEKKKLKNFGNALRSRNIDLLSDFEDE